MEQGPPRDRAATIINIVGASICAGFAFVLLPAWVALHATRPEQWVGLSGYLGSSCALAYGAFNSMRSKRPRVGLAGAAVFGPLALASLGWAGLSGGWLPRWAAWLLILGLAALMLWSLVRPPRAAPRAP
jgi:hypothetical protein